MATSKKISTIKDIKKAAYNPRVITDSKLKGLSNSITSFGDLSGIVVNKRNNTLISGHQRMDSMKKYPSKIVTQAHTDKYGTIAIGHIQFKTESGIIPIPYRVVDWDARREKAANIAANAHGGEFDQTKLHTMVEELQKDEKFEIELIGLDQNELKMLARYGKEGTVTMKNAEKAAAAQVEDDGGEEEFEEFASVKGRVAKAIKVCCPKCKFKFDPEIK